jgi:hypothetical protein
MVHGSPHFHVNVAQFSADSLFNGEVLAPTLLSSINL